MSAELSAPYCLINYASASDSDDRRVTTCAEAEIGQINL